MGKRRSYMKPEHIIKALAICTVLAIFISITCGRKKIDYIQKTQSIEKKACACPDNACAKLALKDYQSLFEELKQNRSTGSVDELHKINASAKKIQECLKNNRITEKEINDIIKLN
jgi:hypothetical protein